MNFNIECKWILKRCAHIASTKSTECPEPRNQGGMIGPQINVFVIEFIYICSTSVINFKKEDLKNLNYGQNFILGSMAETHYLQENQLKCDP